MTQTEFGKEFTRLMSIFGRVNPNEEQMKEWYKSLKAASLLDLATVIDSCRDSEIEFPASPAVLWAKMSHLKSVRTSRPSCSYCHQGRIFYSRRSTVLSVNGHDLTYDYYAACDCDSGTAVADQMIAQWGRRGRDVRVPDSARYSWLFQRFGGIESARGGFGLTAERMPVPNGDDLDGKGETPDLTAAGLARSHRGGR